MIVIDNISIIVSLGVILLAIVSPLINPFFRRPKFKNPMHENSVSDDEDTKLPAISIILTPNENADTLSENLQIYLNQDYQNFQVIVVASKGDTETEDVLKSYHDSPKLYTTFIPTTSRYMSRKKLAITLGVKAAKHEWILMADISCKPITSKWLETLAKNCTEDRNLIVGYTKYDDDTPDFWKFERLQTTCYLAREYQKGMGYRSITNALLFRKSEFIAQDGFRGNLKFIRGEYDFMINKYMHKGSIAFESSIDGTQIEQSPSQKHWINQHLFYMANRKHLERNFRHRFLFLIDQAFMHIAYIGIILVLAFSIYKHLWLITFCASIALVLYLTLRIMIGKKAISLFNGDIPAWKIIPYELRIIWQNLSYKVRYWRANKNDFITHKI